MEPISGQMASQMTEQVTQISQDPEAMGGGASKSASFEDVFSQVQAREVEQVAPAEKVAEVAEAEGPASTRLRDFINGVQGDETRLDKMMSKSMSGAEMSPQELLQMQALIYNYSQKIELATKAVSNAGSGMKQIMNTQV